MTLEEAKKIAAIIDTADGGCPACVRDLARKFGEEFPEIAWRFVDGEHERVLTAMPAEEAGPWVDKYA